MIESVPHSSESEYRFNLLSNPEATIQAMSDVEDDPSFRASDSRGGDYTTRGALEWIQSLSGVSEDNDIDVGQLKYTVYGSGGITRWYVRGDGRVQFSAMHDIGAHAGKKTEKAAGLGFEIV